MGAFGGVLGRLADVDRRLVGLGRLLLFSLTLVCLLTWKTCIRREDK